MRLVLLLARLNELDLAVDALRARVAEVSEALKEPAALRAARRALAQSEAELARCEATQQARDEVQKDAAAKLTRAKKHLYGGEVRSPKELENAQKDVEQLSRQSAAAEDALLEALLAVEVASRAVEVGKAEFSRLAATWEARQVELRADLARLEVRLAAEQARQATARSAVPPDLIPLYDMTRLRRAGQAVAELDGDSCSACRVAASPVVLETARYSDQLAYCENCGRFLWGE